MVAEIYAFDVVIPASTAIATPQTSALTIPSRIVRQIDVIVPNGVRGNVGFRVAMNGQQVIPVNAGKWIVTDGEKISWPITGAPDSGAWQLIAYNTGIYDHTLEVRFQVDLVVTRNDNQYRQPLLVTPGGRG